MTDRIPGEKRRELEAELMTLGNLVERILAGAADLLQGSNLEALDRLADDGRQVHQKRLAIEMGCLGLIAERRPLDGEFRPLVAMVEIATELERLAEHGRRVARANYLTIDHQLRDTVASLHRLADELESQLDGAMAAFAQRDAGAARKVSAMTREIEGLYQHVRDALLMVMNSRPSIANQAIFLSRSAHDLRRASERVAAICAWVEFTVEGSPNDSVALPDAPVHAVTHRT
jgi:phosphate transport system protein